MYKKNYFNFTKFDNDYLITNDFGFNAFLSSKDFNLLINNKKLPSKMEDELELKKFIYYDSVDDFVKISSTRLKEFKNYLWDSTVLHIFVVSKNCNYNCIYCQAGNLNNGREFLMNEDTAKKAVDMAMMSQANEISIEFQGGEPLTNFEIIKYIVEYSKSVNGKLNEKKNITYNIVSNLSLLNEEMIDFISTNDIYVCTSIDGNRKLQNLNRPFSNNDSFDATISNLKKLQKANVSISVLLTTTKFSFDYYKEIVDEYVSLNLDRIAIRPLTNIGKANRNWEKIGYKAEDFIDFYKNILKYIIDINKKGYRLIEGMASIFLSKILNNDSVNYMELRSPCGASIGQMAYYYDGNIFTCDEGRMLFDMGDDSFLLGNVETNTFDSLINNKKSKKVCLASCLECSHVCHSCVYMPYCGTCPILNYSNYNQLEPFNQNDFRCKINKGILETLFYYIKHDKKIVEIFLSWI